MVSIVKVYTAREAGRVIDDMLRQRRVPGSPFSQSAVAALTRESQIAASFGVGATEEVSAAAMRKTIEAPEVIEVPGTNIMVTTSLVTGGQIDALVKAGRISGHDTDPLILASSAPANAGIIIGFVSKNDGDALAAEINRQNPGRSFRLPTEKEVLAIFKKLADKISGINDFWVWTSDETRPGSGIFVLRALDCVNRLDYYPVVRFSDYAVLLVEDKK